MAAIMEKENCGFSNISDLPSDVLTDIFIKLPVKSIFCCARVCSTWRTLIRKPSSDAYRLSLPMHICSTVTVVEHIYGRLFGVRFKAIELMYDNSFRFRVIKRAEIPYGLLYGHGFPIFFNGLLCSVENHSQVVVLFNPILETKLVLPFPYGAYDCKLLGLGFGYVSSTHQYKVVRIFRTQKFGIVCYVSTINGRNHSSRIVRIGKKKPILGVSFPLDQSSVFHAGAIIWRGHKGKGLVYFDTKRDKLGYLGFGPDMFYDNSIGVFYDDKGISHLHIANQTKFGIFQIWVLEDYKRIESLHLKWSIQISDFNFRSPQRLLKVLKDGRLLISSTGGSVACYDLETRFIEQICTPGRYESCETLVDALPNTIGYLLYEHCGLPS